MSKKVISVNNYVIYTVIDVPKTLFLLFFQYKIFLFPFSFFLDLFDKLKTFTQLPLQPDKMLA